MKEESKKYHQEVLALHNSNLYSTLIHEHNVRSETLKLIEFKDMTTAKGYFAVKDKLKYFLDEELYKNLPIRITMKEEGNDYEEKEYNEDVIIRALKPVPFKITPSEEFKFRDFIDNFVPFNHSNIIHWKLMKLIAVASYCSRTYLCISTAPSFGKSSIFDVMHALTDKCPVFKPRSIPGVLNHITGIGNMVFDDILEAKKDVREVMEEMNLQLGGGKSVYLNGALKSGRTKTQYQCGLQSITYLYNTIDCYSKPEDNYFEVRFVNNKAIDDRFLKIRLDGVLTEKFDRSFNIPELAENNKMYYIKIAKYLAYLQEYKQSNKHEKKFVPTNTMLDLKGRRKIVFDEIVWCIDMYSQDQQEYNILYDALEQAIIDYKDMTSGLTGQQSLIKEEEVNEE